MIESLTKREIFAAIALQGYVAGGVTTVNNPVGIWTPEQIASMLGRKQREAAAAAVEMADALLDALKATEPA